MKFTRGLSLTFLLLIPLIVPLKTLGLSQERTRGPSEQLPRVIPVEAGPMGPQIDWKQLLAAIGVMSAALTVVQLLLSKFLLEPKMTIAVERAAGNLQKWAEKEFPTKLEFIQHADRDEAHQKLNETSLSQVRERLLQLELRKIRSDGR